MHPGDTTLHNDMLVIKECLDFPPVAIDLRYLERSKVEVVGDERYDLVIFNIVVPGQAEVSWIQFTGSTIPTSSLML